ncbi:ParB/RepB/Spo0J family partition protein [Paracoccus onubensis]|uniref:Chromosome partitioning protein ParB n=1 Tax=Paracoccus onubensis TaxID=1675788 RepID=A0A418T1N2_9RHOB|nr:ParB N-terminal domain-containing protein [Paracoccus onubensis]RJE87108.1 chromosome partitioning protein ParB [Paracoccus onubensis]
MTEPTLIQTKTSLPIDQIDVSDRLRPVSEAGVATIIASLKEIGQLTSPITVRQKRRKGEVKWQVLDGAHRLAAATELGWTEIPVRIFECTDDQARIMEIDGNLSGAELNPLDTVVFLATRKAVYERMHPETKAGAAGAAARWADATDTMSVAFVKATAEKLVMSERHVRRLAAAGASLGPDEIAKLRSAPRQITLKDLQDISRIDNTVQRYDVVDALAEGRVKNVAAALKGAQPANDNPDKDPVEDQFAALAKAWSRASMVARRKFVTEHFSDLSPLVVDEAETRDELDIASLRTALTEVAAE